MDKPRHLYEPDNPVDEYSYGDIIEAEVGVFLMVISISPNLTELLTEELLVLPEPNQYNDERSWTEAVDNMLLDLILDFKDDPYLKERGISLMKYIKETYDYKKFEERLEEVW